MIPANSLFCVRINNFDYTLNQIDQFLAGVSPMPMGVSMLVRMQLANLLGSPQLNGLNTNGSFAVFGAAMPGETTQANATPNIFIGVLAPVTNYIQLIDGNPNCAEPDEKGISKITMNGSPVMLSAKAGNFALMSWANDYDKLVTMTKTISAAKGAGLSTILDSSEIKLAGSDSIWAYGNVQQVSDTFGPIISAKIDEIKTIYGKKSFASSGLELNSETLLYRAKGCDECYGTGYKGRLGVHELMEGTKKIKRMIKKEATPEELLIQAASDGMTTLVQDGIFKAFDGLTDITEIRRVCVR